MNYNKILFAYLILLLSMQSCKKFLEEKADQAILIPETINDYQAILDNDIEMNNSIPYLGDAAADEYTCIDGAFDGLGIADKNVYLWDDNIYTQDGASLYNWSFPYRAILNANTVLAGIEKVSAAPSDNLNINNIKGSALFFRSFIYYNLAQLFAPPYDKNKSDNQLGIPLRYGSDVEEEIERPSLEETYTQILSDLFVARDLLPELPSVRTRPSRAAVFALLSKIHLIMQNFDSSYYYSNECLNIENDLLDYNSLDQSSYNPIPRFNGEVIFSATLFPFTLFPVYSSPLSAINQNLFDQYDENDLRKRIFFESNFDGTYYFKGSYDGSGALFAGLAIDELYFIRAESSARLGRISEAMNDLNSIMSKRWDNSKIFIPFEASTESEALGYILTERRKELVLRGCRWADLRRLNLMGSNITLSRLFEGEYYELLPNDLKYTFLIPSSVIAFHQNMLQNPR